MNRINSVSTGIYKHGFESARGSATPMKMGGGGGGGDQAAAKPEFSSEGNPYQKPKTQRIWSTIFLKMGGLSPHSQKWGGRVPPVPPCGGAPGTQVPIVPTTGTQVHTYAAAQRHCQPPCEPACDRDAKPFSVPCTEAPTQRVPCEKRFPRFATRPSLTASFNVHNIPKNRHLFNTRTYWKRTKSASLILGV